MIVIRNGNSVAEVNERGELASYKFNGKEYMWNAGKEFWDWHSPVLFPFVGRVKNAQTRFEGKLYSGQTIHGFARDLPFTATETGENYCVLKTQYTDETLKLFPYPFALYARFDVAEDSVSVGYTVENVGSTPMQYVIGGHPALLIPAPLGDMDIITKGLENARYFTADENGLVVFDEPYGYVKGSVLPFSLRLVERGGAIFTELGDCREFAVVDRNTGKGFSLEFPDFPVCTLWMPNREDSPFICVEPWCGLPDDHVTDGNFESKPFRQTLAPGEKKTYNYKIKPIV